MRHSLIAKLLGFLLLYPLSINSAISQNIDNQILSNQLEAILNKQKYDLLKDLFLEIKKSFFSAKGAVTINKISKYIYVHQE